jgi:hypothetical protein
MKFNRVLYLDITETIYTTAIKHELNSISLHVDTFYYQDVFHAPVFSNYTNREQNKRNRENAERMFLSLIKGIKYDIILIKSAYYMTVNFFDELTTLFKNVPVINYNWSSLRMYNVTKYLQFFTKVYSFDREDCKTTDMEYVPLFYIREFERIRESILPKEYDFNFIASGYSAGRMNFTKKLNEFTKLNDLTDFIYLYTPGYIKSFRNISKNIGLLKLCYWKMLSLNAVVNIFSRSISVIDHPMTIQNGLTIRTFESLASGLKLITTNKNITNEPFYEEGRIQVISEISDINLDWLRHETDNDDSWFDSFEEYRIDNWVRRILTL